MSNYYVVLTGILKNAGDYLITEKCKELIKYVNPDIELVQYGRWESLEDKLEVVNNSRGVILMGGPAVSSNFYPNVYRLTENLDDIKVPIIPMAVGWNSEAGDFTSMLNFKFTEKSKELLERFKMDGYPIGVRDYYTNTILQNYGLENSVTTGCASWYTPEMFGKEINADQINTIAYTPAQDPKYYDLSADIMRMIRKRFPNKKIVVSFHRGIGTVDEHTDIFDANNTKKLAELAHELGMETIDLSFSYDNYKLYDNVDYHIGFRVHAHLFFLSNRKPSILLHEDGRGKSLSETMGLTGIDAFKTNHFVKRLNILNKVSKKLGSSYRLKFDINTEAVSQLEHLIVNHELNEYRMMNGVVKNFDENFTVMKEFIKSMP